MMNENSFLSYTELVGSQAREEGAWCQVSNPSSVFLNKTFTQFKLNNIIIESLLRHGETNLYIVQRNQTMGTSCNLSHILVS